MGRVVTSRRLGGLMVSTLARNARDVGLIPPLGAVYHVFIISHEVPLRQVKIVVCWGLHPINIKGYIRMIFDL